LPNFAIFDNTGPLTQRPASMPPKADPYATPMHHRINVYLAIFSLVVAAIVFIIATH